MSRAAAGFAGRLAVFSASWLAALLFALAASLPAAAKEAQPLAEDARTEARLAAIAEELRCLVCQNESLASSRADLAMDLKREIREQIRAGKTDGEIREFLVRRYGDFVLYRPPLKESTLLLWGGPFFLLIAAAAGAALFVRRRRNCAPAVLSAEDEARAEALLGEKAER
jgi:cytochrome c-type biogenesis protein CcmH